MLDRALDRGDYDRGLELSREMLARALESPETELLTFINWMCAHSPAFADRFHRDLLAMPNRNELMVQAVKQLREEVRNPATSRRKRKEAQERLERGGFDDASLLAEDAELG